MKKLVVALAVAMIAIGIVAADLWRQLDEVRMQNSQLSARVTRLQAAQLAAAMTPSVPASAAAASQAQAAAPEPAATGARDKRASNTLLEGVSQMLASPEGKEYLLSQTRMLLPRQYPDLGRELGLTPAEVDKFFDLLARQQTDLTADTLGGLNGGTQDRAAIQERQRKAQERQQANQAEVTAMLGSKVPQWQEYQKTLPVRRQVNQLQATLGAGRDALNDAQSRPLITALAAEQARIQEDRRNAPRTAAGNPQNYLEEQLQRTTESNQRLVSVAASYLSPQQLAGYRRMLEQEENLTRTMTRSMAPQANGAAPAPASPR